MDSDPTLPSVLVAALAIAHEYGDAETALRLTGLDLDGIERFHRVPEDVLALVGRRSDAQAVRQALALGFLAGRMSQRPRPRRSLDPSSFLMDRELFVREAAGQSILRLPWFEEDLFVERRVPEISEFPRHVMRHCLEHYPAALRGERSQYRFTSYGHAYTVEVVPVRDEGNEVDGVLAIAVPARPPTGRLRRAAYWEQVAEYLDDAAKLCDYRAGLYGAAGDHEAAERQRELADAARRAARRAQATGFRHRSDGPWHRSE